MLSSHYNVTQSSLEFVCGLGCILMCVNFVSILMLPLPSSILSASYLFQVLQDLLWLHTSS